MPGYLTQVSNIAESDAVIWAYRAYEEWSARNGIIEHPLPGLDYTVQQMFWISAATNECRIFKSEFLQKDVLRSAYWPEARTVVTFSNFRKFANDFQCKIGTAMNPRQKCNLWNGKKKTRIGY